MGQNANCVEAGVVVGVGVEVRVHGVPYAEVLAKDYCICVVIPCAVILTMLNCGAEMRRKDVAKGVKHSQLNPAYGGGVL